MISKITYEGNMHHAKEYDCNGHLQHESIEKFDDKNNILGFATRKFNYKYNKDGLMVESYSVDTISKSDMRRVYEYREKLRIKETIYQDDSCRYVVRYEYFTSAGEKW
jgi:hypothetical protein